MDKKGRLAVLVAVIALIVSIGGIAFAALTTTLTITGGAEFTPANWDVKFTGTVNRTETGDATGTIPTLTSTSVGTYSVVLTKPGDRVVYTFNVTNDGSIDARLAAFTKPNPVCTGTGTGAIADANMVCDNLIYTLAYSEAGNPLVMQNNTLATGQTRTLVLTIEYPMSMTTVPANEVIIQFPQVTLLYEQQ